MHERRRVARALGSIITELGGDGIITSTPDDIPGTVIIICRLARMAKEAHARETQELKRQLGEMTFQRNELQDRMNNMLGI